MEIWKVTDIFTGDHRHYTKAPMAAKYISTSEAVIRNKMSEVKGESKFLLKSFLFEKIFVNTKG